MKKNILRIISLVLVAGMLFAFSSCTQKILVRFVDADGNDIDIAALMGGTAVQTGGDSETYDDNNIPEPPQQQTSDNNYILEPPSQQTPEESSADNNESQTDSSQATEPSQTPGHLQTTEPSSPPKSPTSNAPSSKKEIVDFYKSAILKVKNEKAAGYTKKEWQTIDKINIGPEAINKAIVKVLGNFATPESKAKAEVNAKGSDEATRRFPNFTLTDYSQVVSATCTVAPNGNYKIKITMKDEDTPKKNQNCMLEKVTNSLLYWEDIEETLLHDKTVKAILTSYKDIHVIYKHYVLEGEITPNGKFVYLTHLGDVDILIGEAQVLFFKMKNKSGHMINTCKYTDFKY